MDKLFQQQQAPKKKQNIIVRIKKEQQDITNTPIMEEQPIQGKTNVAIIDARKRNKYFDRKELLRKLADKRAMPVLSVEQQSTKVNTIPTILSTPALMNTSKMPKKLVIGKEPLEEEKKEEPLEEEKEEEPLEEEKEEEPLEEEKEEEPLEEEKEEETAIRGQPITGRLPEKKEKDIIQMSPYYMNNRKLYISKLQPLFERRRKELLESSHTVSCETGSQNTDFDLLTHQKVVRDYLNLYSPYRGLLLFHGLGSGKTCTSIAIAEGMKSDKQIMVLTPASLKSNFLAELKKCGDDLYKKNQYWEFISSDGNPEYTSMLSRALSLPTEVIRKNKGAWLMNIKNPEPNYNTLASQDQKSIDEQLNYMIRAKYQDINYNGITRKAFNKLTNNGTVNPFDDKVVIVDEAHNFVSRIVNKLKEKKSLSYELYHLLMSAQNVRIVFLSGTPIINYPNEISVLYNMLRGYIKTWTFEISVQTQQKVDTDNILTIFDKEGLKTFDFVEYSGNQLTVTRNPFGFINVKKRGKLKKQGTQKQTTEKQRKTKKNTQKGGDASGEVFQRYNGVKLDAQGNISDTDFVKKVLTILRKYKLGVNEKRVTLHNYTCLPDNSDKFKETFVDTQEVRMIHKHLFQRRILGLTSYFRSAQEELLPELIKEDDDSQSSYHIIRCPMSDHQYGEYEKIRKVEADQERNAQKNKRKKKEDDLDEISGTYRIFSRAACNFVFPDDIDRPKPKIDEDEPVDENMLDVVPVAVIQEADPYADIEMVEDNASVEMDTYNKRIEHAMQLLNQKDETNQSKFLTGSMLETLSPKFYKILEQLSDPENEGLHLIYSNFRTIEGIGILRLILLANGYAEFKVSKAGSEWVIDISEEDKNKPKFVLYTGTESVEEKELIRNIYNGNWDIIPPSLASQLQEQHENNNYGEIIKIFMITASGAEGINLRNTRFVHIVEPYWHNVRLEQVIGRARRICSHQELPPEMRTVKTFIYISVLSDTQKTSDTNIELRIRDVSKADGKTPVTTDEALFEGANKKQKINDQILQAIKETAVDCQLYSSIQGDKHPVICYGYGLVETNAFASYPSFQMDAREKGEQQDKRIQWTAREIILKGVKYAWREETGELFTFESYEQAKTNPAVVPVIVGRLINEDGKYKMVK